MITAHDAAIAPPVSPAPPVKTQAARPARALLNGALFLAILISPLVFIEPSPYEVAVLGLALLCIIAGISFERRLLPLIVLLMLWNASGFIALIPVIEQPKTTQYAAVSLFLAVSAIMYAAIFTQDVMRRLMILRNAYVLAAFLASVIGIIGYFNLFPGAGARFAEMGRANATFKDPNVFGPFLILPLLLLLQPLLGGRINWRQTAALLVILFGLFLSFSRGAWFHFGLSAAVMVALMFLTAPDARTRRRLVMLVAAAVAGLAGLIALALSFDAIGAMFEERARLVQYYDAGTSTGRFFLQVVALDEVLNNPWGLGPHGFSRLYGGMQQHNVYLQAFLVYGWIGGLSYVALTLLTLAVGLRASCVASPWQPFAMAAFATFAGVVVEGVVIDTDHWRHYFLLLGLIWGLAAATRRHGVRA